MPQGVKFVFTAEQLRWLADAYPCTKDAELCAVLGMHRDTLHKYARLHGLQKSPEYIKKQCRLVPGHKYTATPEVRAKISNARRELYKAERRRTLFGLPQRTRLRVGRQDRKKANCRYRMRCNGYVELPGEKNVLFYPSEDMRHPRAEANAARYGLKILPLDGCK